MQIALKRQATTILFGRVYSLDMSLIGWVPAGDLK